MGGGGSGASDIGETARLAGHFVVCGGSLRKPAMDPAAQLRTIVLGDACIGTASHRLFALLTQRAAGVP
ncbi:MAG: hypothetical protein IAG13_17490 [Deltaproteobacteria bacterium]|nr:hypothetical protein [Nannocystaceae bacterium]